MRRKSPKKPVSLDNLKIVHCIGIGGIGLSGLAQILAARGIRVQGSDIEAGHMTEFLQRKKMKIAIGHDKKNIGNADAVIYSLAIPRNHPERKAAREKGIPEFSYPEALGLVTKDYFTIAVCGTHGKTTTAAMLSKIFLENGFDPTVLVGSWMRELNGSNVRIGSSKLMIIEACEYQRAFLKLHPNLILITNIEAEHLDTYKDLNDVVVTFKKFVDSLPRDGYLFANLDDENVQEVMKLAQRNKFPPYNLFTFGTLYEDCDYRLSRGGEIEHGGKSFGKLALQIPGDHNKMNALSAFAAANFIGAAPKPLLKTLKAYRGCARRFEIVGKLRGAVVIDDYGHHPTEIKATLKSVKEKFGQKSKILCVYQPHQHNRTKHFLSEFGQSFSDAKTVIVPNIYTVRDTASDTHAITTATLVNEIKKYHRDARDGQGFARTADTVRAITKDYDVIIVMGAGDVFKIIGDIMKKRATR